MRVRRGILLGSLAILALSGAATAQHERPLKCQSQIVPQPAIEQTVRFGADERQQVDFYAPKSSKSAARAPVILFVHGGGWTFGDRKSAVHNKPGHFTSQGYAFASTGYRLVPDVNVEDQAKDIGRAIKSLRLRARQLGIDPNTIILMGHSAGAHLAALVATDPQYAGESFAAIKGVVLLDSGSYDLTADQRSKGFLARRTQRRAFGTSIRRLRALSPVMHVGAPDAPDWLILHDEDRADSTRQSTALALALRDAGSRAEALPIAETNHSRINTQLGKPCDQATQLVDGFLGQVSRR